MTTRRTFPWMRLMAALFLVALVLTVRAGPLEPPVPPGIPTMHPIDQVEPRIPIYAGDLPLTISEPGSYYLAENIITSGGGIFVNADRVTIDLMGFTLEGGTGPAIDAWSSNGSTIRNGTIANWTDTGVAAGTDSTIRGLVIKDCGGTGIKVGTDSRITDCTSSRNLRHGIYALTGSVIEGCVASNNTENGIWIEAHGGIVTGCIVDNNERNGIRVDGYATVIANHVRGSDISGTNGKAGIWLAGDYNRVEGNTVIHNNIGIDVYGNNNSVVRNIVGANLTRNFDENVSATGNYVPVWSVGSSGSPDAWTNIEQP